jgi:hypothetical protein
MQEAKRCRAQAELCLQIARLMSDPDAADQLHMKAAYYMAQVVELERESAPCPNSR